MSKFPRVPEFGYVPIYLSGMMYSVRYDMHAMFEVQQHFGVKSIQKALANFEDWGAQDYIALITIGIKHGSTPDITAEEVGELMLVSELHEYADVLKQGFQKSNNGDRKVPKVASEDEGSRPLDSGK